VFIESMREAISRCHDEPIALLSPFSSWTKADIVRHAKIRGVAWMLSQTWSCYKGREIHCGKCGTCVERKEAFTEADWPDRTQYETDFPDLITTEDTE
jgi:7-cyano-7-deazaguanine synthase